MAEPALRVQPRGREAVLKYLSDQYDSSAQYVGDESRDFLGKGLDGHLRMDLGEHNGKLMQVEMRFDGEQLKTVNYYAHDRASPGRTGAEDHGQGVLDVVLGHDWFNVYIIVDDESYKQKYESKGLQKGNFWGRSGPFTVWVKSESEAVENREFYEGLGLKFEESSANNAASSAVVTAPGMSGVIDQLSVQLGVAKTTIAGEETLTWKRGEYVYILTANGSTGRWAVRINTPESDPQMELIFDKEDQELSYTYLDNVPVPVSAIDKDPLVALKWEEKAQALLIEIEDEQFASLKAYGVPVLWVQGINGEGWRVMSRSMAEAEKIVSPVYNLDLIFSGLALDVGQEQEVKKGASGFSWRIPISAGVHNHFTVDWGKEDWRIQIMTQDLHAQNLILMYNSDRKVLSYNSGSVEIAVSEDPLVEVTWNEIEEVLIIKLKREILAELNRQGVRLTGNDQNGNVWIITSDDEAVIDNDALTDGPFSLLGLALVASKRRPRLIAEVTAERIKQILETIARLSPEFTKIIPEIKQVLYEENSPSYGSLRRDEKEWFVTMEN